MAEQNKNQIMDSLMTGMESFLSAKTVVGEATKIDDTIILPLVDINFGMGVGTSSADKKSGGGGGMTGKISPTAVLVIKNGQTRLVSVKNQDAVTKVIDMVPDLIDRVVGKKDERIKDEDAVEAAFPEEES
ncbi:MAG: GerW family sporulation protein [Eubacteriales bacterium]